MIEELLEKLARDGRMVVLLKANNGYSAVLAPHSIYRDLIMLPHHNADTVEGAIKELIEKGENQ